MDSPSSMRTSVSLLARLRQDTPDEAAWRQFVDRYGPLVRRWCRQRNLPDNDADDVTQTVLLKLSEKMRSFPYDPERSFRAYLKTLTHYAWCDFLEGHRKHGAGSGDSKIHELLDTLEARDDLADQLQAEFDRELLDEAMARVQSRVAPHTWEAFRLTALEGLSGADAAAQLGKEVVSVFKAKSNVLKMLQEETRRLDPPE